MKTILVSYLLIFFLLIPFLGKSQLITISGTISDSKNGEKIENVNIVESNSNIGTISNNIGFYKLELKAGEIDIQISADNFKDYSRQLKLNNDTTFMVELVPTIGNKTRNKKSAELQSSDRNLNGLAHRNR